MRIVLILMLACAAYGAIQLWPERDALAGVATSANGFVPVEMPGGIAPGAVLVLAPRNCPSEQAQRTEALAGELARLNGELPDFDAAYDRYFPAYESGICGGTCARNVAGIGSAAVYADEWEDAE